MDKKIVHEPSEGGGVFRLLLAGERVGELRYKENPERTLFLTHTEVDKEHEGKGLARELFIATVEYAKAEGYKVQPICPYTIAMFNRLPEYQELLL